MKNSNNKKYLKMMEKRNRALSKEYKKIYKEEYEEKIKLLKLAIKAGENKIKSDISAISKEISVLEYEISGSDKYAEVYGGKLAILRTEYLKLTDLLNNYSRSQEVKEIESQIIMEENLYKNIDNNLLVINSNSTTLNDVSIIFEKDSVIKSFADDLDVNIDSSIVKDKIEILEESSIDYLEERNEYDVIELPKFDKPAKSKFRFLRRKDSNLDHDISQHDGIEQTLVSDDFDSYIEEDPHLKDKATPILEENVITILNNINSEKLIDESKPSSAGLTTLSTESIPLFEESSPLKEENLMFATDKDEVKFAPFSTAIEEVGERELMSYGIDKADDLEVAPPIKKKFNLFRKDKEGIKKEFEVERVVEQGRLDEGVELDQYLESELEFGKLDSYEKESKGEHLAALPKLSQMEKNDDTANSNENDSIIVEVTKPSKRRFRLFRKRVKDNKNEEVVEKLRKESELDRGEEKDSYLDDTTVTNLEGSITPTLEISSNSNIEDELRIVTQAGYNFDKSLDVSSPEIVPTQLAREDFEGAIDIEVSSSLVAEKNKKRFKLFGKKDKNTAQGSEGFIDSLAVNDLYSEVENEPNNEELEGTQAENNKARERVAENFSEEILLNIDLTNEDITEIKSQESAIKDGLLESNEKKPKLNKLKKLKNIIIKEKSEEKVKFNPSFDIEITTANTSISEYDYSPTSPTLSSEGVISIEPESNIIKPVSINISEESFRETVYVEKSKKELKKERKAINKEAKRNKRANLKINKENKRLEVIKEKERALIEKSEREELEKIEKDKLKEIARAERDNAQAEKQLAKELKLAEKRESRAVKLASKLASKEERNKQRLLSKEERRKKSEKSEASLLDNSTVVSDELAKESREVDVSFDSEPEVDNLVIEVDSVKEDALLNNFAELVDDEITLSVTGDVSLPNSSESNDKDDEVSEGRIGGLFRKKKSKDFVDNSELNIDDGAEKDIESSAKALSNSVVSVEYILDESIEGLKKDNYEESKKLTNEKIKNAEEKHRIKLEKQERKDRKKNEKLKAKAERSERRQLEKNRKQSEKDFANQQLAEIKQRSKNAIEAEKLLYESESESIDSGEPKSNFIKAIFERRKINKELKRSIKEELKQSHSDDRVSSTGDGSLSKEEKRRLKVQFKEEKERIKKAKKDQSSEAKRKNKEISFDNKRDKKIESADKNRLKVERDELKKSFKNTKKIEEARRREAKELAKIEEKRIAALRKVESDNIKAQNRIESEKLKKEKEYKKEILAQQKYKSKQQRSLLKEETKINKRAQKIDLPKLRSVNTNEENTLGGSYQWDAESGVFSESDSGSGINFMEYDLPEQLPRR